MISAEAQEADAAAKPMIGRWLQGRVRRVVQRDLELADLNLVDLKRKVEREGWSANATLGDGIGMTAGLLAQRFGISVVDALAGRHLTSVQLADASDDLAKSTEAAGRLLNSQVQSARTTGHQMAFGAAALGSLYRLLFIAQQGPPEFRSAAEMRASEWTRFIREMVEGPQDAG